MHYNFETTFLSCIEGIASEKYFLSRPVFDWILSSFE
jgi:hypothetical protein